MLPIFLTIYLTGVLGTFIGMLVVDSERPAGLSEAPLHYDVLDYCTLPWIWWVLLLRWMFK